MAALRPARINPPSSLSRVRRLHSSAVGEDRINIAAASDEIIKTAAAAADREWMAHALREAEHAFAADEVPIGAVLVRDGAILTRAHNRVEMDHDASAHAEMLCLRSAAADLGTWRLNATTLYVTVEPCALCLAALQAFRVERLVYGAPNTRMGAIESDMRAISEVQHPYHELEVEGGVRGEEAADLMRRFFQGRRDEPRYGGSGG